MKKIIPGISISLIMRIIAAILAVIPVIYTAGHMAAIPEYKKTLIFILLTVVAEILTVVLSGKSWCDFLHVAGAVLMALTFTSFVSGGVLSIADYIAGINLFGDSSQVPAILTYSFILLCGAVLIIIDCFIYNGIPDNSGNKK